MTSHEALNGTPTLLAAMYEFHRLRAKYGSAEGLAPDEETLLAVLVEIFEPLRIASTGLRRTPIALSVNRRALLLTTNGAQRARIVRMALRRVWVETRALPPLGGEVIAAIRSATEGRFYAFRGRVTRTYPAARIATIELVAAETTSSWAEGEGARSTGSEQAQPEPDAGSSDPTSR